MELIILLSSNIKRKQKPVMVLYLTELWDLGCKVRRTWVPAANSSSLEVPLSGLEEFFSVWSCSPREGTGPVT